MVNERRVARLAEQIQHRVAEIVTQELKDPRLGFVTITRVHLDRELEQCKVWWSCLGDDKARSLTEHALQHARGFVQREVAKILSTRVVPALRFEFDESIAGTIRLHNLIDAANRGNRPQTDADTPTVEGSPADVPPWSETPAGSDAGGVDAGDDAGSDADPARQPPG